MDPQEELDQSDQIAAPIQNLVMTPSIKSIAVF